MSGLRRLFNTRNLPTWLVTLNIFNAAFSVVCWPFVVFMAMVAFSAPHIQARPVTGTSESADVAAFFAIVLYPVYLVLLMLFNFNYYRKYKKIVILLSVLPLLVALVLALYYIYWI